MNQEKIFHGFKKIARKQKEIDNEFPIRAGLESRSIRAKEYQIKAIKLLTDIFSNRNFEEDLELNELLRDSDIVEALEKRMGFVLELVSYGWTGILIPYFPESEEVTQDVRSYFDELFQTICSVDSSLNEGLSMAILDDWINFPVTSPKGLGFMFAIANHVGIDPDDIIETALIGLDCEYDYLLNTRESQRYSRDEKVEKKFSLHINGYEEKIFSDLSFEELARLTRIIDDIPRSVKGKALFQLTKSIYENSELYKD